MNNHQPHLGPAVTLPESIECIVLAGGLGTRLRTVVSDLPKCMAPVAGRPFLAHLIDHLLESGVTDFIFALGYMHETIETFLNEKYPTLSYRTVIENEPLGTGGAISLACKNSSGENLMIVNGDTLFSIDVKALLLFHLQHDNLCTLALKPMLDFDRYGVVEISKEGQILDFKEKTHYPQGLINGGVYVLNRPKFLSMDFPDKFSFEKDFLERYYQSEKMCGLIQNVYFIDIGIPEDFLKANADLK